MEATGGEPDVVNQDRETGRIAFCDCSLESPPGRRSLYCDCAALDARKEQKPHSSAVEMAAETGIDVLAEEQYRELQELGEFDTKTSSWVWTPSDVRTRGGALFCDRRYGTVFLYHNGAQSYYAGEAFRRAIPVSAGTPTQPSARASAGAPAGCAAVCVDVARRRPRERDRPARDGSIHLRRTSGVTGHASLRTAPTW